MFVANEKAPQCLTTVLVGMSSAIVSGCVANVVDLSGNAPKDEVVTVRGVNYTFLVGSETCDFIAVDDQSVRAQAVKMSAGPHTLDIRCFFSYMKIIKAVENQIDQSLSVDLQPGHSYQIHLRKGVIVLEDKSTGKRVPDSAEGQELSVPSDGD